MKPADILSFLGRLLVGGVLVYAGFSKALAPAAEFAAALTNYQLFPAAVVMPLAIALPWLEIWTGLFLIAGLYMPLASTLSTLLFAGFLSTMGLAKLHHVDLTNCGCFGGETMSPQTTFKMDVVLLAIALAVWFANRQPRELTLDRHLPR